MENIIGLSFMLLVLIGLALLAYFYVIPNGTNEVQPSPEIVDETVIDAEVALAESEVITYKEKW